MPRMNLPRVAVLLAAYNGKDWIREQISSILSQSDVEVELFVSLDKSSDNTLEILEDLCKESSNINVLPYGERFGSAGRNFFRLIRDVDISAYDYVAFSDQDDLWFSDKLSKSVSTMLSHGADAYSSDVIAVWLSGRQKLIKKSEQQQECDFLFESAGPGCTYLFSANRFSEFSRFITERWEQVLQIEFHDWLAYAFFRAHRHTWIIDSQPSLMYRQHSNNQFGANASLSGFLWRLRLVSEGWYAHQVKLISSLLGLPVPTKKFVFANYRKTRRKTSDAIFMLLIFWSF